MKFFTFNIFQSKIRINKFDKYMEEYMNTGVLARYHFHNTIYLYGVFERNEACSISAGNVKKLPLILYETPLSASKACEGVNIQNPVTLAFAVDIGKEPYFDYFIEESKESLKKSRMTKSEYIKKCRYIRKADSSKRIVYEIKDVSIITGIHNI